MASLSQDPATIENVTFHAADGRRLEGDFVRPLGKVRAKLVIHGATAVPRGHYVPFAKAAAARGFETLIYDYRGVGGSALADPREDPATMTDWLSLDAPAAVRTLHATKREVPFFAVGHSFGGQIAAALEGVPAPVAIATAGAQRGYWATFPWNTRPKMFLNWFVLMPSLTGTLGYLPASAGLGVDMPKGVVSEWARWCKTPRYYLDDHPELGERLARWEGRLLALSVTDDAFAPLANVEWLIERHRAARLEHVRFTPDDLGVDAFGHFGFFRSRHDTSVWSEILGFFEESLGTGGRPRKLGRVVSSAPPPFRGPDDEECLVGLAYGR